MSSALILILMTCLFLFFGYMGVPVAFSLIAGTVIGAAFTDVTFAALVQKMFDGVDSEALLAIPFFLLVGELMSSANVVQRVIKLSLTMVGHMKGGLSQVVCYQHDGFAERSENAAQVGLQFRAHQGVERSEWFVEQQRLRIEHQGPHQADALPLPAGELRGKAGQPFGGGHSA